MPAAREFARLAAVGVTHRVDSCAELVSCPHGALCHMLTITPWPFEKGTQSDPRHRRLDLDAIRLRFMLLPARYPEAHVLPTVAKIGISLTILLRSARVGMPIPPNTESASCRTACQQLNVEAAAGTPLA